MDGDVFPYQKFQSTLELDEEENNIEMINSWSYPRLNFGNSIHADTFLYFYPETVVFSVIVIT